MIEVRSVVGTLYKPTGGFAKGLLEVTLRPGAATAPDGLVQRARLRFPLRDGRPCHVNDAGEEVDGMQLWVTEGTESFYVVREPSGERWNAQLPAGETPLSLYEWKTSAFEGSSPPNFSLFGSAVFGTTTFG